MLKAVINWDNIRVIQLGNNTSFFHKTTGNQVQVLCYFVFGNLDGNSPFKPGMACFKDMAHRTFTDELNELIIWWCDIPEILIHHRLLCGELCDSKLST